MREHSASAKSQERDGDCQKSKMIKKHNREETSQSQFQQEGRKAAERDSQQQ